MNLLLTLRSRALLLLLTSLSLTFFMGCRDDDNELPVENSLSLNESEVRIEVGDSFTLVPSFGDVQNPQRDYNWTIADTTIATFEWGPKFRGIIHAVGEGSTTATLASTNGNLQATATITTFIIRENQVSLPANVSMTDDCTYTITPVFDSVERPVREYDWTVEPSGIVEYNIDPTTQAITLIGQNAGSVTASLKSKDGVVSGSTQVSVVEENDGIIKVLTIGNSFSEDAVESYLWDIAQAAGKKIVIGNLYIGGANLSTHVSNASTDAPAYSYRKIELDGSSSKMENTRMSAAIKDENWDVISMQQASYESGLYNTFETNLPDLYQLVSQQVDDQCTKYVLHRTWAYAQHSTHDGFANYNNDQMTMYNDIISAYDRAKLLIPTYDVIPSGTGIQNGRTSYLGDGFTRDGYHLNEIGKYIASSVWFEKLFDESILTNTFAPTGISTYDINLAKTAAHAAVQNPEQITTLDDFLSPEGSGVITDPVFINFSTSDNADGWNQYNGYLEGASLSNTFDNTGTYTGISIKTIERFRGASNSGLTATTTDLNMPDGVSKTFFYSNGKQWGGNDPVPQSVIEFSGFTSNASYQFCFFGSRSASDNRETLYTLNGASEQAASLNAAGNASDLACINNVQADAEGKIRLTVTPGPNNSQANAFYYLNALRIQPAQ